MVDHANILTTPLIEEHKSLGARLGAFGGWMMPIQYSGIIDEHMWTRKHAGLFDICHMGEFLIVDVSAYDYAKSGDLVLFSYSGARKDKFDGGPEKPEAQIKIIGAKADVVYDDDAKKVKLTNFRP